MLKLLRAVAEELNIVLGLQPVIDTSHDEANLRYLVEKASSLVKETDTFSKQVATYITELSTTPAVVQIVDSVYTDESKATKSKTTESKTTESKATESKATKKTRKQPRKKKRKPHIIRIESLITESIYTSKEIVEIILSEFPEKRKDTITTYVRSTKNPKYNPFDVAVIEVNGVFKFEEQS